MRTDGLFQKGEHPTPEMRAKMAEAQRRRWAEENAPELEAFLAKVQRLLDECYSRMRQQ